MDGQDPLGEIDQIITRVMIVAVSISAAIGLVGREWREIAGQGLYLQGIVGTTVAIAIVLLAWRTRR